MTEKELEARYFDWMYRLVADDTYTHKTFRRLFSKLFGTTFTYTIPMDGNRAEDGIDLRYRFGREHGYTDSTIATLIDIYPCSILEMMIALALRCEEHIMADPDMGDRTGQWFWDMIVSLGLGTMDDSRYDPYYVDEVVERFLNREYDRNGEGGLFTVNDGRDMRHTEIWYQMNYYLVQLRAHEGEN